MTKELKFWGIHTPKGDLEMEEFFLQKNLIAIGWTEMGNLGSLKNRENFKKVYKKAYPNAKPGVIPVHAGEMFRFVNEMNIGDIIIFPLKSTHEIWLGKVTDQYSYNPKYKFPHYRTVKWLNKFPRIKFSQGALYEIGSALTFFQVRNYAEEFATTLNRHTMPKMEPGPVDVGLTAEQAEEQSHDFVLKQLSKQLKGHELAQFVGHLLSLMGYKVQASPPGPDHGIDIIAYKDALGIETPKVFVQVKSADSEEKEATLAQLYGRFKEPDHGIFVSLCGFNKNALNFASGKRNLRLIDGDELVDLIYEYYEKLDGKYKNLIPLRRVYLPEIFADKD